MTDHIKIKYLIFLPIIFFVSYIAQANDNFHPTLGQVSYNGDDCPQGAISAKLTSDFKSMEITFDDFRVKAGGRLGDKRTARKNCEFSIELNVPTGWKFSVFQVEYNGFNNLPKMAASALSVEFSAGKPLDDAMCTFGDYFKVKTPGPKFKKSFEADVDEMRDEFFFELKYKDSARKYSSCGQLADLRTKTHIRVSTNKKREKAILGLAHSDKKPSLVFHLDWKECFEEEETDGVLSHFSCEFPWISLRDYLYFWIPGQKIAPAITAAATVVSIGTLLFGDYRAHRHQLLERNLKEVRQGLVKADSDDLDYLNRVLADLLRQRNNVNMWGELKAFFWSFRF